MSPAKPNEQAMKPETLRALFKKNKLKIGKAAERLGVSRATLHRWLNGSTPISRANLALIEKTFPK